MWARRMLTLVFGASVLLSSSVAVASAATGDRPKNVAKVKADNFALLHGDGTVAVAAQVRCDPGWVAGELSATLTQGESSVSGYTIPSVSCDGRRHRVEFDLVDSSGPFQPGKVTFSFLQFLVTNAVTGDSAGAHDNGAKARLRLVD
jgi:hypothetical protein